MTGPQIPIGTFVVGLHGEPLGHVAAVYLENATGRPAWAAVQGRRHTAVIPTELSRYDGATLHVPFDSERLRTAPVHDPDTHIDYDVGDDLPAEQAVTAQVGAERIDVAQSGVAPNDGDVQNGGDVRNGGAGDDVSEHTSNGQVDTCRHLDHQETTVQARRGQRP